MSNLRCWQGNFDKIATVSILEISAKPLHSFLVDIKGMRCSCQASIQKRRSLFGLTWRICKVINAFTCKPPNLFTLKPRRCKQYPKAVAGPKTFAKVPRNCDASERKIFATSVGAERRKSLAEEITFQRTQNSGSRMQPLVSVNAMPGDKLCADPNKATATLDLIVWSSSAPGGLISHAWNMQG